MNVNIKLTFSLSIVFCLVLSGGVSGQQSDNTLINDVEIMETVLDKIISPQRGSINILGSNSKGFYLKGYGVIFNVSHSSANRQIFSFTSNGRSGTDENEIIVVGEGNKKNETEVGDELKSLKEALYRFYGDWAPAFKNLPNDERVTVIVDFNGFFSNWYRAQIDDSDESFRQLIASAQMNDIVNYKREKINLTEFKKKIDFDKVQTIDEDISIMSNVIQTALQRRNNDINLSTSEAVKGIYLKGYGAVFITNLSPAAQSVQMYLRSLYKDGARTVTMENNVDKGHLSKEHLHKVEDKMIRVLSNYGHTLRSLKNDEWLEVALNLRGTFFNEDYSKSILKIQKKNLDDFNKDKINYNQLKKQFKIIRY